MVLFTIGYERAPSQCHRSLVRERLQAGAGIEVTDLFPPVMGR